MHEVKTIFTALANVRKRRDYTKFYPSFSVFQAPYSPSNGVEPQHLYPTSPALEQYFDVSPFNSKQISIESTVARWPNFRLNNSKEAPKNSPWPEKIGRPENGEILQKVTRGREIFLQLFSIETI
jgi:hypothetical protein